MFITLYHAQSQDDPNNDQERQVCAEQSRPRHVLAATHKLGVHDPCVVANAHVINHASYVAMTIIPTQRVHHLFVISVACCDGRIPCLHVRAALAIVQRRKMQQTRVKLQVFNHGTRHETVNANRIWTIEVVHTSFTVTYTHVPYQWT